GIARAAIFSYNPARHNTRMPYPSKVRVPFQESMCDVQLIAARLPTRGLRHAQRRPCRHAPE
ncbi:MAG: hypothetical protein ACKO9F_06350, partial [Caldilinea sp.]